MICPECNGKGEVKYYREVDRDENSVTVEGHLDICHTCHGSGKKPMTNADHIRSMTDEELAQYFGRVGFCNTVIPRHYCLDQKVCSQECVVRWLKQPYKEDA